MSLLEKRRIALYKSNHQEDCKEEDCTEEDCKEEDCKEEDCKEEDCKEEDCKEEDCTEEDCTEEDCTEEDCKEEDCKEDLTDVTAFHLPVSRLLLSDGVPSSDSTQVKVTVLAVNQFRPQFTSPSYQFTVPETAPVGFRLGVLNATDQDNDDLVYSLRGAGNGKSVWRYRCYLCQLALRF